MTEIAFTFDGRPIAARPGQSLAAALTEAGVRAFRDTVGGAERGVFCGMGVCQDCLLTVDGTPNRRACMTLAEAGMVVAKQVALPDFGTAASAPEAGAAQVIAPDVLILGGGAGGLSAAIAARGAGASVVVLDERKVGGGQYYKQAADASVLDGQQAEGAALVAAARASGAEIVQGAEVWGAFDGPMVLADVGGAALIARPKTLIVATGAYERPVMVPGWTLPGVMTTGAAQTLWRSYRTLPGRRVAVCGSGPLNLQVALELAEGGAEIALVAERAAAPITRPLEALALALSGPKLTWNGMRMLRGLKARRVPVRNRTELVRVEKAGEALSRRTRCCGFWARRCATMQRRGTCARCGRRRWRRRCRVSGPWATARGSAVRPPRGRRGGSRGGRRRRGPGTGMPTTCSPTSGSCAITAGSSGGSGACTTSDRKGCWTCPTRRSSAAARS
ncbi:MAG: 2Fe-2S iron-sulfur cluster-binding protein [Rhodobacteraceae bacterium]|nr:2Fe-2S iron-sulfur cluster-binding protein [Paracoccaceae bacterium]